MIELSGSADQKIAVVAGFDRLDIVTNDTIVLDGSLLGQDLLDGEYLEVSCLRSRWYFVPRISHLLPLWHI